ncbi:hypothetical protein XO12_09675 [Marinitoga sp. 1154]|nr:hypothetical protein [Marinitoga sp. 1154]
MSDNTLTTYDEFIDSLNEKIEKLYKKYEIPKIENNLPTKFGNLIEELNEKYSGKEIYIIGININSEKRNIEDYIIEKI